MDWNDLTYLLAAYRHRSLAGAARELRCEHTTISRRLAALETALGDVRLFTRTPTGLAPTAIADAIVPIASEIEALALRIERTAVGHDQRVEGTVRVTMSETFATFVIQRLGELRARYPELVVEVLADNRVLDLSRGDADLALRFSDTTSKDLLVRKIGEAHWGMYASRAYLERRGPVNLDDLADQDVVGFDDTLAMTPGARWLATHAATATKVFAGNGLRAVYEATRAGLGITVLPYLVCDSDPDLVRISAAPLTSRPLSIVVHPELANVARIRAVIDFLADIASRDRAVLIGAPASPDIV